MFLENLDKTDYYDSSNILASTYDDVNNILYITFSSGGIYSYEDINKDVYEKFKNSESQGKFFIANIEKNYKAKIEKKLLKEEVLGIKTFIKNYKK